MSRSVRTDYDALRARERAQEDAAALARAILTRRRRKCIAQGSHTDDCQRCGTK